MTVTAVTSPRFALANDRVTAGLLDIVPEVGVSFTLPRTGSKPPAHSVAPNNTSLNVIVIGELLIVIAARAASLESPVYTIVGKGSVTVKLPVNTFEFTADSVKVNELTPTVAVAKSITVVSKFALESVRVRTAVLPGWYAGASDYANVAWRVR